MHANVVLVTLRYYTHTHACLLTLYIHLKYRNTLVIVVLIKLWQENHEWSPFWAI